MHTETLLERRRGTPRLRIGLLAPPWVPVPPPSYGGIEQVVATLAERARRARARGGPGRRTGLGGVRGRDREPAGVAAGHHRRAGIRLAARARRARGARGCRRRHRPLRSARGAAHLAASRPGPARHARPARRRCPRRSTRASRATCPRLRLVAISEAQRAMAPRLPFAGGLPQRPRRSTTCRSAPAGRLPRVPRAHVARRRVPLTPSRIAQACRPPAADRQPSAASRTSTRTSRGTSPRSSDPTSCGWASSTQPEKYALLAGARALLFPIAWPEPFGMVMIEAMACGTPGARRPRAAPCPRSCPTASPASCAPPPDELVEAVAAGSARSIAAPAAAWVAERFSADAMTAGYERLAMRRDLRPGTRDAYASTGPARRVRRCRPPKCGRRATRPRRGRVSQPRREEPVILAGAGSTVTLIDGLTFAISDALRRHRRRAPTASSPTTRATSRGWPSGRRRAAPAARRRRMLAPTRPHASAASCARRAGLSGRPARGRAAAAGRRRTALEEELLPAVVGRGALPRCPCCVEVAADFADIFEIRGLDGAPLPTARVPARGRPARRHPLLRRGAGAGARSCASTPRPTSVEDGVAALDAAPASRDSPGGWR